MNSAFSAIRKTVVYTVTGFSSCYCCLRFVCGLGKVSQFNVFLCTETLEWRFNNEQNPFWLDQLLKLSERGKGGGYQAYLIKNLFISLSLDQLISWRDVASWTFWRKSIRSSASLPAWVVVMSIQSFMSCSHLLVGLPLPLLPSILASKMCLSSVSWRLMWPKYLSFSAFAFCRSIVVFISNLESTSLLVTFSIQDILKIFL